MNDFGWLLLEVVGLLAVIQSFLWVYNHGFDTAKQKIKLENQQPLAGLREFGFVADSDVHSLREPSFESAKYRGCVNSYSVEISVKCRPASYWRESQCFKVRVFFNPGIASAVDSSGAAIKNKAESNFFKWQNGVALCANYGEREIAVGRFTIPDSQRLFAAAQELAIELEKLGLNPNDAD